jgi:predicted Zn-dependent protease
VIPEVIETVAREQLRAAGFLGLMARSEAYLTREGISVYSEETDGELTVTARTPDGKSSGWGGAAARNWTAVNSAAVTARATALAHRYVGAQAFEPGRRTAILSTAAVAQIMRHLAPEFDAYATDCGKTGFSSPHGGSRLGQRVFDPRISMRSDPADPEGGYRPYFEEGYGTPAMTWIEQGTLKNLAYGVGYAMMRGKTYAEHPYSLRISGGTTSLEEMIAQCQEGIYVNRLSGVDLVDQKTGLITGVTRDGCFLVRNGKIDRPVKNFRFLDSPFFFLNRIKALGVPARAAFGYTPPNNHEEGPTDWPRWPMIVPPMMVSDFNFSSLADAV